MIDGFADAVSALWAQYNIKMLLGIFCIFVLFLCVTLSSIVRTYFLYKSVIDIPFSKVAKSSVIGSWYNVFTIPFLGNFIGQARVYKKSNIPSSLVSTVVVGERVFMLLTGAILFFILLLASQNGIDIAAKQTDTLLVLLEMLVFISACTFFTKPWRHLPQSPFERVRKRFWVGAFGVTLLQWASLTLIFAACPMILLGLPASPSLFLWSFCIGFVASLPINVAGFGLREIASIYFLGLLGISHTNALAFSVLIGVISIGSLALLFYTKAAWRRIVSSIGRNQNTYSTFASLTSNQAKAWHDYILVLITLGVAILVPFHFHYVSSTYAININVADPIALSGCVMFIFDRKTQSNAFTNFPMRWFGCILAALSIALGVAFMYKGFSAYSLLNKAVGFLVLIGYAYIGFSLLASTSTKTIETILTLQLKSLTIIILWKTLVYIGFYSDLTSNLLIEKYTFDGFSHDRNAFGLILVLVLFFYHFVSYTRATFKPSLWFPAALYFGVYLTHSRTALVVALAQLVYLIVTRAVSIKQISAIFLRALTILLLYLVIFWSVKNRDCLYNCAYIFLSDFHTAAYTIGSKFVSVLDTLLMGGADPASTSTVSSTPTVSTSPTVPAVDAPAFSTKPIPAFQTYANPGSDNERLLAYSEGLKLFLSHPIFGVGLGQFREMWIRLHGHALIIHNSFLWVLAEMGLVGFVLIYTYPLKLALTAFIELTRNAIKRVPLPAGAVLTFGTFLVIFLYAMPQEIFYQRIVWFYLGVMFALQHHLRKAPTPSSALNQAPLPAFTLHQSPQPEAL